MNLKEVSDEELLRLGRDAVKLQSYLQGRDFLSEYCDRLQARQEGIPGGVLATFALALANTHQLKGALEVCLTAVSGDRRNPYVYLCLAQIYVLMHSRMKALETVERGLKISREHRGLLQLRHILGVRQTPAIPFLSRDSAVNRKLGRVLHRLKSGSSQRFAPGA